MNRDGHGSKTSQPKGRQTGQVGVGVQLVKEDRGADSESELWNPKSRTPGHPARNSGCCDPFRLCLGSKSSHQPHSAWTHTRNLLQQHSPLPSPWQRLTSDYSHLLFFFLTNKTPTLVEVIMCRAKRLCFPGSFV